MDNLELAQSKLNDLETALIIETKPDAIFELKYKINVLKQLIDNYQEANQKKIFSKVNREHIDVTSRVTVKILAITRRIASLFILIGFVLTVFTPIYTILIKSKIISIPFSISDELLFNLFLRGIIILTAAIVLFIALNKR